VDGVPLERVAERLRHQPGLGIERRASPDGRAALGAVDLGHLCGSGRVFQRPDGSLAVVHGEITNLAAETEAAVAVLDAYRLDPGSLARLQGSYVLAIWDAAQGVLVLANDRFGLRNVYYSLVDDVLCFAPLVGALLALPTLERRIDLGAVADFLTFHHVLGDRTLLRGVRALPPATIATFDGRGFRLERYWSPRYREAGGGVDGYVEEFGKRLQAAVARTRAGPSRPGLPLSGGLDSRAILSVLVDPRQVPCFTYGVPRCDDLRIGALLAQRAGAPHHVLELQPGFIAQRAADLVRLTDGMHLALNVHATMLQHCARWCDVIVLGNGGDCLLDGLWTWSDEPPANEAFARRMFARLNIGLDRRIARRALSPLMLAEFATGPAARLRERLALYPGATAADAADAYNVGDRHWRWTLQGVPAQTTHVEFREPFYDYDLADFALGVPAWLRTGRRLHVELISRRAPALAALPRQGTGRPIAWERVEHPIVEHVRKRGRAAVRRLSGTLLRRRVAAAQRLNSFADYGFELRSGSRALLERVLLADRTLDRGWFDPEGLGAVVMDHLERRGDHAAALGAILTLELWLREFVDAGERERDPPVPARDHGSR
jgi:asparagine synthase (glutamine-hydrolysing)